MIALWLLYLGVLLGLCRAITLARRAGYLGFWAFFVWALLLISRETMALAEAIREGQRKQQAHREEWDRATGFGTVRP